MPRFYAQKGWLNDGDYRAGFIIYKRHHEKAITVDLCWWFGWVMVLIFWDK